MHLSLTSAGSLLFALAPTLVSLSKTYFVHEGNPADYISISNWLEAHRPTLSPVAKSIDSVGAKLIDYGSDGLRCENLIVVGATLPKMWGSEDMIEYGLRGGNLLWIITPPTTAADVTGSGFDQLDQRTRQVAKAFGRLLPSTPSPIIDYTNLSTQLQAKLSKNTGDRIIDSNPLRQGLADGSNPASTTMGMRGWSHRLDSANPLVFPILTAPPTAISTMNLDGDKEEATYGTDNIIASALESRRGGRITLITSAFPTGDGRQAAKMEPWLDELMNWTFNLKSRVAIDTFKIINLVEPDRNATARIGDTVEVRICLRDTLTNAPFLPSDAQLEAILVDPCLRLDLHPSSNEPNCLTSLPFTVPNRIGTLTLRFVYQRRGLNHVKEDRILVLRPLHHDEWERIRGGAAPYYLAWLSMIVGAVLLLYPVLFFDDNNNPKNNAHGGKHFMKKED